MIPFPGSGRDILEFPMGQTKTNCSDFSGCLTKKEPIGRSQQHHLEIALVPCILSGSSDRGWYLQAASVSNAMLEFQLGNRI